MTWDDLWKYLLGPTGLLAAVATWLFRRRRGSGSWIGRRLNVERALIACQEETTRREGEFSRQTAATNRELEARDREIAYLMGALNRINTSAAEVLEVHHDAASAATSSPSPTAPTTSPAPSPTSPARPPTSTRP